MIHVLPINDICEHELATTCNCEPTLEVVEGEMLLTHSSYDRREDDERDGSFQGGWQILIGGKP